VCASFGHIRLTYPLKAHEKTVWYHTQLPKLTTSKSESYQSKCGWRAGRKHACAHLLWYNSRLIITALSTTRRRSCRQNIRSRFDTKFIRIIYNTRLIITALSTTRRRSRRQNIRSRFDTKFIRIENMIYLQRDCCWDSLLCVCVCTCMCVCVCVCVCVCMWHWDVSALKNVSLMKKSFYSGVIVSIISRRREVEEPHEANSEYSKQRRSSGTHFGFKWWYSEKGKRTGCAKIRVNVQNIRKTWTKVKIEVRCRNKCVFWTHSK